MSNAGATATGRPTSEVLEEKSPVMIISALLVFLVHAAFIGYLSWVDVPEDLYDDPTKIPERFVKLIVDEVPEEEPEAPVEEAADFDVGDEAQEEVKEDEAGGGGEDKETAPQNREEKREAVRSKGVLALITAKGGGGALQDVLSGGGLGESLDSALSNVSGVGVAGAGVDVRTARGGGGAGKAGIGDLNAGSGRGGGLGTKAQKKVVAAIQLNEKIDTSGALSAEVIRSVMQENIKKIKACYDRELAKDPKLNGKIEVSFTIGEDGKVKGQKIKSSTMKNEKVESCILQRIRRFEFPKPSKGEVKVNFPFVFETAG